MIEKYKIVSNGFCRVEKIDFAGGKEYEVLVFDPADLPKDLTKIAAFSRGKLSRAAFAGAVKSGHITLVQDTPQNKINTPPKLVKLEQPLEAKVVEAKTIEPQKEVEVPKKGQKKGSEVAN